MGEAWLSRVQRRSEGYSVAQKGAIGGARGGEYHISKSQWSSGKIYAPGGPSTGQKGSILFLDYFSILGDAAKLRWTGGGARSAPFGVPMSSKKRVRAAHGRARAAKTH
jgi:hypothetical protein